MKIKCYGINNRLYKSFITAQRFKLTFPFSDKDVKIVDNISNINVGNLKNGLYSIIAERSLRSYYIVFEKTIYFICSSFLEYSKHHYVTQGFNDLRPISDYYLTETACKIKSEQKIREKEYEDNYYKFALYFKDLNSSKDFKLRLEKYKLKKGLKLKIDNFNNNIK